MESFKEFRERSNRGDRSRGGRSGGRSGGSRFGGSRDRGSGRGSVEMHDVVCDECSKECQVPFKPTESKPIYCNECFEKKGGRKGRGGSSGMSSEQFEKIDSKLNKIMRALKIEEE